MTDENRHAMGYAEQFAHRATHWTGSTPAFSLAVLVIVIWAATGPIFRYSDTWQLVINTSTTVVTFLMVFLIQRAQNNDSHAVHLKLNELIAAMHGASNRLIGVEELSEADADILRTHYRTLVERAKADATLQESHPIEEAEDRHEKKAKG